MYLTWSFSRTFGSLSPCAWIPGSLSHALQNVCTAKSYNVQKRSTMFFWWFRSIRIDRFETQTVCKKIKYLHCTPTHRLNLVMWNHITSHHYTRSYLIFISDGTTLSIQWWNNLDRHVNFNIITNIKHVCKAADYPTDGTYTRGMAITEMRQVLLLQTKIFKKNINRSIAHYM